MVHQLISELDSGSKNVMTQKRIITYYMHNHSSTIPDLAKEIDLSIPTVTKFITEMCDAGYLVSYGKQESTEGRPPNLYGLNPDSGYLVGTYQDEYQKCVDLSGISFQGIAGGGIRAFYTEKHTLESVVFAEEAPLPVLTFATQPKRYTEV